MNEQEATQEQGVWNISKEEVAGMMQRARRRIRAHYFEIEDDERREQALHKWRMGMAVTGGAGGGILAGHAVPTWGAVALGVGVLTILWACISAVSKLQGKQP